MWAQRPKALFCDPTELSLIAVQETLDPMIRDIAHVALGTPANKLRPLLALLRAHRGAVKFPGQTLARIRSLPQSDMAVHDAFFGIRRLRDVDAATLVISHLEALELLQTDLRAASTRLDDSRLWALDRGIRLSIAAATGGTVPVTPLPLQRTSKAASAATSVRRWLRGHHTFAALSQGLILSFDTLTEAQRAGDLGTMITATATAAEILVACAASLEFTGDLPAHHYNDIIRHAMAPPLLPAGFSGLHSRDHRQLVKGMKDARPALDGLKTIAPDVQARVPAALAEVYESHKAVCSAFVGADEKSLLMSSEMPPSSIEQLENFKRSRLRLIGAVSKEMA
jgi:hypothetical protein